MSIQRKTIHSKGSFLAVEESVPTLDEGGAPSGAATVTLTVWNLLGAFMGEYADPAVASDKVDELAAMDETVDPLVSVAGEFMRSEPPFNPDGSSDGDPHRVFKVGSGNSQPNESFASIFDCLVRMRAADQSRRLASGNRSGI